MQQLANNTTAFTFKGYRILEIKLNNIDTIEDSSFTINFAPDGIYYSSNNIFKLILEIEIHLGEETNNCLLSLKVEANFQFDESIKNHTEIPSFFYKNSIAIIFPYIRAFISTISLQANIKPIILPLLNLSSLETQFKENTVTNNTI